MSQYVIDPFDPNETTAINLIQPSESPYPVVHGYVRQQPGSNTYIANLNGKDTTLTVIEADGMLPGVVPPHQYNRRIVLSPTGDPEKILAIETGVNSKTFVAVRSHDG